jgi:MFS transporter, SP family, solute carrier family 2 (myo-inositol transporter), member 13
MYFSATIFTMLGFSAPTLASLSVATTNFAFTVTALVLIDRIGRRRILLYSIPLMVIGLLVCGIAFAQVELPRSISQVKIGSSRQLLARTATASAPTILILLSMIVYVAAYALGLGNVPWMQSELFALDVRSLGSGLATATNWSANFVVGLTFLPLMDAITPSWTFVLYASVCAIGWLLVRKMYPETAGLTLEAATALLENGWSVA